MDSDDFPYSSPKILDCERICRGINKERKKELFILFPKEERGQMHRVILALKGEGFSFLLKGEGQERGGGFMSILVPGCTQAGCGSIGCGSSENRLLVFNHFQSLDVWEGLDTGL